MGLSIEQNRKSNKYSAKELSMRVLWSLGKQFFKYSPRIFFKYRAVILKLFGARVGQSVHIYSSAHIFMPWNLEIGDFSAIGEDAFIYNLGKVTIGKNSTISHRAYLCAGTHDYSDPTLPLIKPPIFLEDNAWVCADAFIGPGVTIKEGAVVGARAAVFKDVEPWSVVGGNPAKFIKIRILKNTS